MAKVRLPRRARARNLPPQRDLISAAGLADGLLPQRLERGHAPSVDDGARHRRERLAAGAAAALVKGARRRHHEQQVLEGLGHRLRERLGVGRAQVRLEQLERTQTEDGEVWEAEEEGEVVEEGLGEE